MSQIAGTRRNIHPLDLSWSSIILYLLLPSNMIHSILHVQFMCLTVFFRILCPSFLWTTSWPGTLHFILYTLSSFATYAHTIATCFAVVPRLCHLILVSLSTLYLELYHVTSHRTSILPFSSLLSEVPPHFPFLMAMQHTTLHTTTV